MHIRDGLFALICTSMFLFYIPERVFVRLSASSFVPLLICGWYFSRQTSQQENLDCGSNPQDL